MDFQVEYVQKITIITLTVPTLEMKNVVDFKYDVIPYLKANPKIIIDLSRLQFIDSSGCGALSFCQRTVKELDGKHHIKLCGVSKQVASTFRLIRFNRLFDIFDTREGAIQAFLESS